MTGAPPSRGEVLAWTLGRRIPRRALRALRRRAGLRRCTYGALPGGEVELARLLPALPHAALAGEAEWVRGVAGHYRAHRFDLLGSGWVAVAHGRECAGVEGHRHPPGPGVRADAEGRWLEGRVTPANQGEARRVWSLIGDPEHVPVDWQRDVKSGFRWSERDWYADVRYGHAPGADVKVPWELSRMQHLVQLAWADALGVSGAPGAGAREFRAQVLDWIAQNPPGFGANWASTMDVAIRAANWVVAYDAFRAGGAAFDAPFRAELARSLHVHGGHIAGNLEWSPGHRGNHYLSNVTGLLFVAAALPAGRQTDAWLAFGVQELVGEAAFQFHADGANFEGSTAYHRLSAEMLAYGAAVVRGLPEARVAALARYDRRALRGWPRLRAAPLPRYGAAGGAGLLPPWFGERLERAAEFTVDCTGPGGIVQFGDNDSGRFLKLRPAFRRMTAAEARARFATLDGWGELADGDAYWYEDPLDHAALPAVVGALRGRADLREAGRSAALEGAWAAAVAGVDPAAGTARPPFASAAVRVGGGEAPPPPAGGVETVFAAPGGDLRAGVRTAGYPHAGVWFVRSPRLFLAVRCGAVGQGGHGGHDHNDQLGMELWIDGAPLLRDPGTYLYTPLPARRNAYRSVRCHAAPRVPGREPGDLSAGLFRLVAPGGRCTWFGPGGFAGTHDGYGFPVVRVIRLEAGGVRVHDAAEDAAAQVEAPGAPPEPLAFSPGYGILER